MKYRRTLYVTDYCLSPYERIPQSGILCQGNKIIAVGGSSAFQNEDDLQIWLRLNISRKPPHSLFFDRVCFSENFETNKYKEINYTLNDIYLSRKIGYGSFVDSIAAA